MSFKFGDMVLRHSKHYIKIAFKHKIRQINILRLLMYDILCITSSQRLIKYLFIYLKLCFGSSGVNFLIHYKHKQTHLSFPKDCHLSLCWGFLINSHTGCIFFSTTSFISIRATYKLTSDFDQLLNPIFICKEEIFQAHVQR